MRERLFLVSSARRRAMHRRSILGVCGFILAAAASAGEIHGTLSDAGLAVLLPWGNSAESDRSARLAAAIPGAEVCARRDLPELAALLARAEVVCGVDTGLVHLAAALGAPTVALFVATDPRLAGVARAGPRCRDLGATGVVPAPSEVIATIGALLRSLPAC